MKIVVTGLESSGTKWMTDLLRKHPDAGDVVHTSIPEFLMCHDIKTRWPDFSGADFVVWMWRYEKFRLCSIQRLGYNQDRSDDFMPPKLYENCERLYRSIACPVVMVPYAGLIGPCGRLVFLHTLRQIGLPEERFPWSAFCSKDENAKYIRPVCC